MVKATRILTERRRPGTSFQTEIFRKYGVSSVEEVTDPTFRMWIDFALSTIGRGEHAVGVLGGRRAMAGKRVLDVGCAYGGFLVAAKRAGARSVMGIDINPDLISLARKLLTDYRVRGTLAIDDVTSPTIADRLGTFDVVICNDVIEHVVDPAACAANLSSMLRPGGSVFLEIPNSRAVEFMRRDGHYGLFGITLLDRQEAEGWWRHHYPSGDYGVEHYAPLAYYLEIFSQVGISLRLLNAPPESRVAALGQLEEQVNGLEQDLAGAAERHPEAPIELIEEMRKRGTGEIVEFRRWLDRYRQSTVPAERELLAATLINTYGSTFWELVGRKA